MNEDYLMHYLRRNSQINPFPREFLRKRMTVDNAREILSFIPNYEMKTDIYTSLFSQWQMKNNIYDCVFLDVDCYIEVGETLEDLNKMSDIVDNFLSDEDVWYRKFFTGKKGFHYYAAFPPTHFHFFANAARKWAEKMPKLERVDMQKYWYSGEIERIKTWPFDPRTVAKPTQLVRIPHTKHPKSGLKCVETYGRLRLPMKERKEDWLPEMNIKLQEKLKMRDREPEIVDRSGGMIDFEFVESPKCIRNALKLMRGHLTHDQSWHFANFMITLGATNKEIFECFKIDKRYNDGLAETQINSIRSSGLANMGCDKIKFIGLCDEKQSLSCPLWPNIDRYLFGEDGT